MTDPDKIMKAGAELAKAVPIYKDLVRPAAKSLGRSLETVAKAVHAALYPVAGLVWCADKFKGWLQTKVAERMRNVPPECIVPPAANVAGPAIEALKYTEGEEPLQDMYASLLASAMDKRTKSGVLPAFVEIIKQMTSDEAKIVERWGSNMEPLIQISAHFAKGGEQVRYSNISAIEYSGVLSARGNIGAYLDNLRRLGLISIDFSTPLMDQASYDAIAAHPINRDRVAAVREQSGVVKATYQYGYMCPTVLGTQFRRVCIPSAQGT